MLNHSHFSVKKQIYDRIAYLGVVSKADLIKHFSIASSSMTRLLEDMLEQKLILISGHGTSTGDVSLFSFKQILTIVTY